MRRFLRLTGWAFIGTAAFVLSFLVHQVLGTNSVAHSAQADLRQSLERQWGAQAAGSPAAPNPTASAPAQQVARGQAFAIIRIPRIGVERVVVEGVGRKELRKGPGPRAQHGAAGPAWHVRPVRPSHHVRGAVLPARRAPTRRPDPDRHPDGGVHLHGQQNPGRAAPRRVVLDNVPGPDSKPKPTITLTTCTPRFSARQRLIVFGDLTASAPNRSTRAA